MVRRGSGAWIPDEQYWWRPFRVGPRTREGRRRRCVRPSALPCSSTRSTISWRPCRPARALLPSFIRVLLGLGGFDTPSLQEAPDGM